MPRVRYRIRVNRASLDNKAERASWPIIVENALTGARRDAAEVKLDGDVVIVFRPDEPLQDGTRVWVEADKVKIIA